MLSSGSDASGSKRCCFGEQLRRWRLPDKGVLGVDSTSVDRVHSCEGDSRLGDFARIIQLEMGSQRLQLRSRRSSARASCRRHPLDRCTSEFGLP